MPDHRAVDTDRTITVPGVGRVSIEPDLAEVRLGVVIRRPTVGQARTEAARLMAAILDGVVAAGVPRPDIRTTFLAVQPAWEHDDRAGRPRLAGHEVSNVVTVVVRDLDRLGSTIDAALGAGATSLDGLDLRVADPGGPQAEARAAAVADARGRADVLAAAAGVTIAGLRSITEGSGRGPIVPVARLAMAEAVADTPIEAGRTEIAVAIEAVFDVDPA
jgi:uncharacterized protein YggE